MPNVPLPENPRLEHLRNQARDLQRAVNADDGDARAHVAQHDPQRRLSSDDGRFRLSSAQVVIARHYGFRTWAELRRHLEIIDRYSWTPSTPPGGGPGQQAPDPADEFLRLACLTYTPDDDPSRWARARVILRDHPQIRAQSIQVAAATTDLAALQTQLGADPSLARARGGPYNWEPLAYLAYARHDPDVSAATVAAAVRLLTAAGADPNVGYLWNGLPTPFTALTGAFGSGELGSQGQPPHPRWAELARALLVAGADPNDAQTLYNRMFSPDNAHLELLLEHGLGSGDGGPWRRRLGPASSSPAELIRGQLDWAVSHGQLARVRLFAEHGMDLRSRSSGAFYRRPRTLVELAALSGHPQIVEYLISQGQAGPRLPARDAYVAAVLAGDRTGVEVIRREQPEVVARLTAQRPGLIVWAAAAGRLGDEETPEDRRRQLGQAVTLLLDAGFDVNAFGRGDVPVEQPWQTALHQAAADGNVELAELLLARGADPELKDARFDGTALDWATHFGHQRVIELLNRKR